MRALLQDGGRVWADYLRGPANWNEELGGVDYIWGSCAEDCLEEGWRLGK